MNLLMKADEHGPAFRLSHYLSGMLNISEAPAAALYDQNNWQELSASSWVNNKATSISETTMWTVEKNTVLEFILDLIEGVSTQLCMCRISVSCFCSKYILLTCQFSLVASKLSWQFWCPSCLRSRWTQQPKMTLIGCQCTLIPVQSGELSLDIWYTSLASQLKNCRKYFNRHIILMNKPWEDLQWPHDEEACRSKRRTQYCNSVLTKEVFFDWEAITDYSQWSCKGCKTSVSKCGSIIVSRQFTSRVVWFSGYYSVK